LAQEGIEAAQDALADDEDTDAGDANDADANAEDFDIEDLEDAFNEFDLNDFIDDSQTDVEDFSESFTDGLSDAFDSLSDLTGYDVEFGLSSTGWTMMYKFNMIVFIILLVQSLLLAVAVFVPALRTCLCCLHCCCTNNVHIVMLIMALVYRFSSYGVQCAGKNTRYDSNETHTFANDASFYSSLSIAGICLWLVFFCGPCCIASAQAKK